MTRRAALLRSLLAALWFLQELTRPEAKARLAELEAERGGRLGVAALDLASGHRIVHRGDERFAMCSTFKFLATALVLTRVDRGEERLDRRIVFSKEELVEYSPVTNDRVDTAGMTVAELCEATMTVSDNTAANLLLASFGGPEALTNYARSIGDAVTRLDRIETELNEATPGDPRDTTTPSAMLENLRRIVLGDALSTPSRELLTAWLVANKTGDARLRAGFPKSWRVGEETGTGHHGSTHDIGVAWPPDRAPSSSPPTTRNPRHRWPIGAPFSRTWRASSRRPSNPPIRPATLDDYDCLPRKRSWSAELL
jgi:beta-lactamase class A